MAKYRCPECGAAHKDPEPYCRLCGGPMTERARYQQTNADHSIDASRFERRGMGHFVVFGVIVGVVLVLGAVWLGVVEGGEDVREISKDIPGLGGTEDQWFLWPDPTERIIVEVPAIPEESSDPLPLAEGSDTAQFDIVIGDVVHTISYTDGLDFSYDEDSPSEARILLETAADNLAELQDAVVLRRGEVFTWQGRYPAIEVTYDGMSLAGAPAFGTAQLVLADGELVFLQTLAAEQTPDTFGRIRDSLTFVADQPDLTIPTIPPDAPGSGGLATTPANGDEGGGAATTAG